MVVKLAITLGLKVNTLINVLWIFVIYKCFCFINCPHRKYFRPKTIELEELENGPSSSYESDGGTTKKLGSITEAPLSFVSLLKVGFLKLFKLNYTSTVIILLQLVHCERIHDQLHLYISADHLCYVWWQWLVIVLFLPMLILFPLSFGMALDKLEKRMISTNTFLVSCVVPFAFYISGKCQKVS